MPEERSTGTIDGDRALNRSTVWKTIPRSVTSDVDSPLRRDLLGTDLLGTERFIKVPYALSLSRSYKGALCSVPQSVLSLSRSSSVGPSLSRSSVSPSVGPPSSKTPDSDIPPPTEPLLESVVDPDAADREPEPSTGPSIPRYSPGLYSSSSTLTVYSSSTSSPDRTRTYDPEVNDP